MTEMVTVTFEVSAEELREASFARSVNEYQEWADQATSTRSRFSNLVNAALVEAKEALPPTSIPVTKDTPNGTKVREKVSGKVLLFIGSDPSDSDWFYADDSMCALWCRFDEYEVVVE